MRSTTRTILLNYGGAVILTGLAVLLRWLLHPWLGDQLPLTTLYGAVAIAVWLGGYRQALFVTVIGFLACAALFIEPRGTFGLDSARSLIGFSAYLCSCAIIVGFGEAMRVARRRSEFRRRQVEQQASQRGQADRAVKEALDYAENIVATVREPLLVLDADLQVRTANRAFYETFRVSPKETEGCFLFDLGNGQWNVPQLRPLLTDILPQNTTVEDFEIQHTFPSIGQRVMRLNARRIHQDIGKSVLILLAIEDITSHEQAQKALRASEECLAAELGAMTRLHALSARLLSADNLHTALDDVLENAIVTSGADFGNIQLYNPQAGALEIVAQRGFRQDFLDYFRQVRVDEGSACAQAMRSGQRIILEDVELDPAFEPHRRIAAAAGYRAVQSTPLKSRNGSVLGMLSTHFRLPQRVSERNQRLLDLYARHAADLIERLRMEEALNEADRRKDEFLATLAHELRNPLAPIRNALELLRRGSGDATLIEKARSMMGRQVGQMVRLVDDLLDISRITRGKLQLRKERVELADILNAAVETARPLIEASAHELTVTLPSQPVPVQADPTRLAQVLANLLNNAAKYTEKAGHIWLTAERRGGEAVVSVRDTGIGIPAEPLPRLFEMFSQVSSALERSQGGLGIGLALVKGLVEMHGGRVEARSGGVGSGSEFTVTLPVAEAPMQATPEPGDDGEPTGCRSKYRILVVDDNRDAADSLTMMLTMMGHDIQKAYDGLEAVQAAAAFRPDVVLLDIGLRKMNGYEAARHIRQQPWGRPMTLIAVTGWGQEEDRRRAFEAGFDHHLTKPVEPAALEKLLAALAVPVPA